MPYAIAYLKTSVPYGALGKARVYKILRVFDNGETLEQVAAQINKVAREYDIEDSSQLCIVYSD